ncbi:GTPase-associated system all-helical protein GASH [Pseudoxanthomonas sp.]|uniref:GTPase-associated system all-helical protein GASH n=1 Tax=Pseudoxanthomonas sp. TaxID=1871049 RepID=UPI0025E76B46|nr:GTPase-associated system all-helical protein GASH [Pseudoxanthomonas sp.]
MENISTHMRISAVAVSDDEVNSRKFATSSLVTSWNKERDVSTLIRRAADVASALGATGAPSQSLGNEVQAAIQKKSSAFLYEERPLDVGICAGMAMVSLLDQQPTTSGWTNKDVYATALWLALSYQPVLEDARRERLRQEVLGVAEKWAVASAEKARQRVEVRDAQELKITIGDGNVINHNFKVAIGETVDALRRNAALDREELDFLWWVQSGASRVLGQQISSLDETTGVIVAALEAATVLRRLPSDVHREIVLKTLVVNPKIDIRELLATLGEHKQALGAPFIGGYATTNPSVFPVLAALAEDNLQDGGALTKRTLAEWGSRTLLEASLISMSKHGLRNL